jgi:hypothetical protein
MFLIQKNYDTGQEGQEVDEEEGKWTAVWVEPSTDVLVFAAWHPSALET